MIALAVVISVLSWLAIGIPYGRWYARRCQDEMDRHWERVAKAKVEQSHLDSNKDIYRWSHYEHIINRIPPRDAVAGLWLGMIFWPGPAVYLTWKTLKRICHTLGLLLLPEDVEDRRELE